MADKEGEIRLSLEFGHLEGNGDNELGFEEYLIKKFLEAGEEREEYHYTIGVSKDEESHYISQDARIYKSFCIEYETCQDSSCKTRDDFNKLINSIQKAIEIKDQALNSVSMDISQAIGAHSELIQNSARIATSIKQLETEMKNPNTYLSDALVEKMSSTYSQEIESLTSIIPMNLNKLDEALMCIMNVVVRDEDSEHLFSNLKHIDNEVKENKRDALVRTIYKWYRTNLKENKEDRNTVRNSFASQNNNTSVINITTIVGESKHNGNIYANKLEVVKEDFDKFLEDLMLTSASLKTRLNEMRIKFSKYSEKNMALRTELFDTYKDITEKYMGFHQVFKTILQKDYCLIFGLICKSRLLLNRSIQRTIKDSIRTYSLICQTQEYIIFVKEAAREMGPRIDTFNEEILEKMKVYHSRNTKSYLFTDTADKNKVSDEERCELNKVEGRYTRLKDAIDHANVTLKNCLNKLKVGARNSEYNQNVYNSNMGTLTYKVTTALERMRALEEFLEYNFSRQEWELERHQVKQIMIDKLHLKSLINQNDPRTLNKVKGLHLKLVQYKENILGRVNGIAEAGKEGEEVLSDYIHCLVAYSDSLDNTINSSTEMIGEMMRNCVKSLAPTSNSSKTQMYIDKMRSVELRIKQCMIDTSAQIPWESINKIKSEWAPIKRDYKELIEDDTIIDYFTSDSVIIAEKEWFNEAFKTDMTGLIELIDILIKGFDLISLQTLTTEYEGFKPKSPDFKARMHPYLESISNQLEKLASREVKKSLLDLAKRETILAQKIHELIEIQKVCSKLTIVVSNNCISISKGEGSEINQLGETIKNECKNCSILSFSKPFFIEIIKVNVFEKFDLKSDFE